jgi:hypothetical protein
MFGACAPASAAPVSIGRASTETPAEQNWQIHSLPRTSSGINGGVEGQLQMVTTAMWLASTDGGVDAVLVFEGSKDSYAGSLQWSASCETLKPSESMFVRNQWRNRWTEWRDDCLMVAGPFDLARSLENASPDAAALMAKKEARFEGAGYVIRATVSQNGTTLTAWLFAQESFQGSTNPLVAALGPAKLPGAVVQWGIELSNALQASTLSFSGKFNLPPIGFRERKADPVDPRRGRLVAKKPPA